MQTIEQLLFSPLFYIGALVVITLIATIAVLTYVLTQLPSEISKKDN